MAPNVPLSALRVANPVVRAVLRSRLHPILSRRLLLLSYRGRRSGSTYAIPLRYSEAADGTLVAVAVRPERKLWWRSFRPEREATVVVRGRSIGVRGALLAGRDRDAALAAYVGRYPGSAQLVRAAAVVGFQPG